MGRNITTGPRSFSHRKRRSAAVAAQTSFIHIVTLSNIVFQAFFQSNGYVVGDSRLQVEKDEFRARMQTSTTPSLSSGNKTREAKAMQTHCALASSMHPLSPSQSSVRDHARLLLTVFADPILHTSSVKTVRRPSPSRAYSRTYQFAQLLVADTPPIPQSSTRHKLSAVRVAFDKKNRRLRTSTFVTTFRTHVVGAPTFGAKPCRMGSVHVIGLATELFNSNRCIFL